MKILPKETPISGSANQKLGRHRSDGTSNSYMADEFEREEREQGKQSSQAGGPCEAEQALRRGDLTAAGTAAGGRGDTSQGDNTRSPVLVRMREPLCAFYL